MSYFREGRNVELSTVYFIETSINADWTGITTVKSFVNAYKAALPVISVEIPTIQNNLKEIGSTSLFNDYTINIDIFAKSHGQRMDLADYLVDKLKDGFTYYVHSQTSGDPETLTRVDSGRIHLYRFLSNQKLDFGEEGVDTYDRYRHFISIQVRKDIS
jgi:hypothetical protein